MKEGRAHLNAQEFLELERLGRTWRRDKWMKGVRLQLHKRPTVKVKTKSPLGRAFLTGHPLQMWNCRLGSEGPMKKR